MNEIKCPRKKRRFIDTKIKCCNKLFIVEMLGYPLLKATISKKLLLVILHLL